mmetsp:Transcript_35067/g.108635  ORF Transcript_35067/g.108635 Transcript_35067/m.108635 type:complete len:180 (+) Transcript_35067:711-1250(+)
MEISDLTSHLTVYFFLRWAAFYYVVSGRFVSTKDTMMGPDCVGIAPAIMRLVDGFQWKSLDEFRADILPLVRVIVLRPHYACALLPLLFSGIQSHEHSHLPSILRSVLVLGLLHCTLSTLHVLHYVGEINQHYIDGAEWKGTKLCDASRGERDQNTPSFGNVLPPGLPRPPPAAISLPS